MVMQSTFTRAQVAEIAGQAARYGAQVGRVMRLQAALDRDVAAFRREAAEYDRTADTHLALGEYATAGTYTAAAEQARLCASQLEDTVARLQEALGAPTAEPTPGRWRPPITGDIS